MSGLRAAPDSWKRHGFLVTGPLARRRLRLSFQIFKDRGEGGTRGYFDIWTTTVTQSLRIGDLPRAEFWCAMIDRRYHIAVQNE